MALQGTELCIVWSKKPVKAILFDVGGVLVQTRLEQGFDVAGMLFGCTPDVLKQQAAPLIHQLERGEIDTYSLWDDLGETLEQKGLGFKQKPEKCESLWLDLFIQTLRVDQDMMNLCGALREKYPVGILSNTIDDHAYYLKRLGVYDKFDPCLLSCEMGVRKPEASIYSRAIDSIDQPAKNILFIDDLPENIKAAKSAKMQTHLFTDRASLVKELNRLGVL